jgi:ribosome-binding factor A
MATIRQAKVGEAIKRDLAEILQKEMRDPRLAMATITGVEVARDFTVAKVFVSVIGTPEEKAAAIKALQGAAGFLRGHLGRMLDLRSIPALVFRHDTGIERGIHMFELLRQEGAEIAEMVANRPPDEEEGDTSKPDEERTA